MSFEKKYKRKDFYVPKLGDVVFAVDMILNSVRQSEVVGVHQLGKIKVYQLDNGRWSSSDYLHESEGKAAIQALSILNQKQNANAKTTV